MLLIIHFLYCIQKIILFNRNISSLDGCHLDSILSLGSRECDHVSLQLELELSTTTQQLLNLFHINFEFL